MNKNITPVGTIVSYLMLAASAFLIYKQIILPAQIILALAFFASGPEIPKFTSWFQFTSWIINAILLGATFELSEQHFPLLTFAIFLGTVCTLFRLIFYTSFIHTKLLWLDSSIYFIAIGLYVVANIIFPHSWQGWVFPLPIFIFNGMLISNFIKEGNTYKKINAGGYGVKVNHAAPDFTLPDTSGKNIALSDFRGKQHVLLLFIRGDWCPACHMMVRTYERNREKFQEKNVFLLAVGPDNVGVNRDMAERMGLEFSILSDQDHKVSSVYGVHVDKDPISNFLRPGYDEGLPLPASFLICDQGKVRYHSSPERVGEFLNPDYIFDVLKRMS